MRSTAAQRLVDDGAVTRPEERPPGMDERAWRLLVRHVCAGVAYAALATEERRIL